MVQHIRNRLDASFAALSDPTRRGILERLGRADASITELADKFDIRKVSCVQFLIQGIGLITAITSRQIHFTYLGFFLYGTGLAGSFVLREVIWANFFGRNSLGTVRGLSMLFSHLFAASGAPFFGFLHDRTGSYDLSFTIFSCALFTSAFLVLLAKPPRHESTTSRSKTTVESKAESQN